MDRRHACAGLLLLAVVAAACGGGGGGSGDAALTFDAPLVAGMSKTVRTSGTMEADVVRAGDRDDNDAFRGFYTFTTADLPPDAVVQAAVLRTQQISVFGHPHAFLGDVVVDHVDVGPTIDATDYGRVPLALDIGTLSDGEALGWRTLEVADAVRLDRGAGRVWTTFRLRFGLQTNLDGVFDYVDFSRPAWPEDDRRASLVIRYTRP